MQRSNYRSQDFRKQFFKNQTTNQKIANGDYNSYGSGDTYTAHEQRPATQRHNQNIDHLRNPAGGDGEYTRPRQKEYNSKFLQRRLEENRYSDEVFSDYDGPRASSSPSVSSKPTTVIEFSNQKAKRLLNVTRSKANLMKTFNEGIEQNEPRKCSLNRTTECPGRRPSRHTLSYESEESLGCPSPSAEVINEKIINPIIKKFRRLYLHNIKEEVTIIEYLEKLPYKLNEVCRKLEKD